MTVERYLEWEPRQEIRYEFVGGEVFAMTGGSLPHNDIAINLLVALRPPVRAGGCRVNMADAKVNVTPSIYRYPDLAVSCGGRDRIAVDAIRYPKLIVEVLSPGTEALARNALASRDRGDKFKEYRSLPTLEEYVVINSTRIEVEIYRRGEGRLWLYTAYGSGDSIELESIGFEFPITLLYEDIFFGD
ncbi:Uma2 family endonuclease [Pannus brasiliensis CCIBt3594]|uniref:Uma2 family endonuclease n=1 Tax=Pannus brasiliensis CCIBt3594 TaxID=1427578 RepID=A0AAW9QYC7_9CHRO